MVFADHGDLQFLARAKMRKHARFAHAGDIGQRADGKAFQPDVRSQPQRRVDDDRLSLLAFLQHTALTRSGGSACGLAGSGDGSHAET
ncbi:hypothetical protein SDC9_131664 [bioreactor metagenome]|uniref:Uncharacterized protein n=1 Tax=bioreactor metagenome TaxID=1076179 RepID=A0A645D5R8_9ZZZZ